MISIVSPLTSQLFRHLALAILAVFLEPSVSHIIYIPISAILT